MSSAVSASEGAEEQETAEQEQKTESYVNMTDEELRQAVAYRNLHVVSATREERERAF